MLSLLVTGVVVIGPEELSALDIVHKVAHEGHHHLQDVARVLS